MLHLLLLFRWRPTSAECSRMQSCGEAAAMWKDQGPWTAWVQLPALPLLSSVALGKLLTDGSLRFIWKMEVMIPVSVIVRIKWDKNGISSSRAWIWELDYKETWAPKNWCLWTVVLEKSLESPLNCKEIKPVNPKGNQSWIFIGRTDAETSILWPPDAKNWLIWKDPDDGKNWRQKEKGMTEDEIFGWHHRLNGHEFE